MSVITPTETEVRPFHIDVPEAELVDLCRRTAATRWPDPKTVADQSQGVQMATLQDLVHHWGTDYDWRIAEARLNALPQFLTRIDGLDIHFLHVRSPHPGAMPLLMTHGWPGSILELLKVIGPLTDPTAHGGRAEDACHVVMPSIPGYGFSGKPAHQHRGVLVAFLLGRRAGGWRAVRHRGHLDGPRCRDRFPRRDLPRSAELG
jgi:hypothetical protein